MSGISYELAGPFAAVLFPPRNHGFSRFRGSVGTGEDEEGRGVVKYDIS